MTTERVLPAVALPAPARPATAVRRPRVVASARVARRNEAWLTTPARAGMLIGASAAVYAVTLAGVSGLQSQSDAELVARRQPWMDQLAETRAANDRLEATIVKAGQDAQSLATLYAQAGDAVTSYEARLDALAALVADVQGTVASLPTHLSLPKVTVRGAGRTRPSTTSTSGASGG